MINHYNLQPDKNGMLKCPFHGDTNASLKIYNRTNSFNCFGCGKNGDAIEFFCQIEEDKHKGIMLAKELCGHLPVNGNAPKPKEEIPELTRIAVLSKFAQYSNASFKRTAKAKEYGLSRGLDIEKMEAGYMGEKFGKGWQETLQKINPNVKNCEQIRQSVIAEWLKTEDVRQVQYKAGHSYVSTTEGYQTNNLEDLQEALNTYHPLQ